MNDEATCIKCNLGAMVVAKMPYGTQSIDKGKNVHYSVSFIMHGEMPCR
jgi:hypothetical protein